MGSRSAVSDSKGGVVTEQGGVMKSANELETSSIVPAEWSVEKALQNFSIENPSRTPDTPVPFFHLLSRLKTTKREGWRRFGIAHGESISDHMYRMSIITMLAPPSLKARGLNVARCTQMAVVHDMAESLVGDITPQDNVAKQEKSRREETTMEFLTQKMLGNKENGMDQSGQDIMDLWSEYEESKTLESKFVHDVDKLELMLQMVEYERGFEKERDLGEFAYVANKIQLPEVRTWCLEILMERQRFWGEQHSSLKGAQDIAQFIKTQKH